MEEKHIQFSPHQVKIQFAGASSSANTSCTAYIQQVIQLSWTDTSRSAFQQEGGTDQFEVYSSHWSCFLTFKTTF